MPVRAPSMGAGGRAGGAGSDAIAADRRGGVERGAAYLLQQVSVVGPFTRQWSEAVVNARGIEGTRVLQGLLSLTKKHPCESLEKACEIALSHGCYRLRTVRQLVGRKAARQEPLPFLEEHPIIRPLADYGAVVAQALERQADRPGTRASGSVGEGFLRHGSGVRGGFHNEESPDRANDQGPSTSSTRPRSGYPLPGCTSAEPGSVSPDSFTIVPPASFHQEHFYE